MPLHATHLLAASEKKPSPRSWRQAMKDAVRDPAELCRLLKLPPLHAAAAKGAAGLFPLFVPREFVARMRPGDPGDPLLRQVLPAPEEENPSPGFSVDPVDDAAASLRAGLLQKYEGRALLVVTGACAVHCRYCFRRHFPYGDSPGSLDQWEPAIEQIARDESIDEVILSGGDPLTLSDDWLAALTERLAAIGHLRRLRLHTRLPIMIPQRVCNDLLAWLTGSRLTPVVVVHANHPAEIDRAVADSLRRLVRSGATVLNQSVLLRDVNDNADVLTDLSRRLVDLGVLPYYLHQLDRVAGAAHFETPIIRGREIIKHLRAQLPGYAVPRYVQEIPGEPNKRVLA